MYRFFLVLVFLLVKIQRDFDFQNFLVEVQLHIGGHFQLLFGFGLVGA
jgi:hypothetical protein